VSEKAAFGVSKLCFGAQAELAHSKVDSNRNFVRWLRKICPHEITEHGSSTCVWKSEPASIIEAEAAPMPPYDQVWESDLLVVFKDRR